MVYRVRWEKNIDAAHPFDAAMTALSMVQGEIGNGEHVFIVMEKRRPPNGSRIEKLVILDTIDLDKELS